MPRVNSIWKTDPDRCRYYRLRADKIEMENALARQDYVEAKQVKTDLTNFCGAILARIEASDLSPATKTELLMRVSAVAVSVGVQGAKERLRQRRLRLRCSGRERPVVSLERLLCR
jgi:hypothetical protein